MKTILRIWSVVVLLAVVGGSAHAQPFLDRVYVSETDGNNTPPCGSIKKPCQTFAFSETRVAPKGRIIVLNTGEYGPVRITKSLTIEAPEGVNALIQQFMSTAFAGSFGVEIAAGPTDVVTLRGIKISLFPPPAIRGIVFSSGAALYVERCVVQGPNEGIDIFPFGFAGDVRVFVRDTVVSNAGEGLRLIKAGSGSVQGTIERCSFEGNFNAGLAVRDGAQATARDSVMTRSRSDGVSVGSSSAATTEVTLESCVISGNGTGIGSNNANATVRVSNSTITDNQLGIDACCVGVMMLSRGNNTLEANTANGTFTGVYVSK